MDQDATWYGGRRPGDFIFDGNPVPPQKKGTAATQFLANVYCGQTAGWMKTSLCTEVDLGRSDILLGGDPAPLPKKGRSPLPNFWPMSIVAKRLDIST